VYIANTAGECVVNTISTTQQIEIEVLSPLHIGAGGDNLLNDVDYVSTNEKIYVIDEEAMFQALSSDRLKQAERATSLSQLLHHREYDQFARYVLDNPTGSGRVSHMVRQMKTAYGAPYVPGSSLKGAIRTALFWAMLAEDRYGIEPDRLGKSPRFADDPLEKKLLAPASRKPRVDPNRDILRAFQVKDSQAISAPDALTLLQVTLYSLRGRPGSPQRGSLDTTRCASRRHLV
jgi:CRISPR-associated protein Csm5